MWIDTSMVAFADWSPDLEGLGSVVLQTKGHLIWDESDVEPWPTQSRRTRGVPQPSRTRRGNEAFVKLCQRSEK